MNSALTRMQTDNILRQTRKLYSKSERTTRWTIRHSEKIDLISDEDLRRITFPKKPFFTSKKHFRREIYRILTINGSLVNWFYALRPSIKYALTGIVALTITNQLLANTRSFFDLHTETLAKLEHSIEYTFQIIAVVIASFILIYSFPDLFARFFSRYENRLKRIQFNRLMDRLTKFNPFLDMHELDYNSDDDPVGSYLWFSYIDLAKAYTEDEVWRFIDNDTVKHDLIYLLGRSPHVWDCNCINESGKNTKDDLEKNQIYFKDDIDYDEEYGPITCFQKQYVIRKVMDHLLEEFPVDVHKSTLDLSEFEKLDKQKGNLNEEEQVKYNKLLIEKNKEKRHKEEAENQKEELEANLKNMALTAYDNCLRPVQSRSTVKFVADMCSKFSINPPSEIL